MSAIAGLCARGRGSHEVDVVTEMLRRQRHRGPDGDGLWSGGSVVLGHAAFHTTPSAVDEQQPITHPASGCVIVGDIRLDNRDELLGILGETGRSRSRVGDAGIVVAAYAKWGTRCPEFLLGAFVFAIWDPNQELVFAARDHFGVRPLIYAIEDDRFLFASEVGAVLAAARQTHAISEEKVHEFLVAPLEGEDPTGTFFSGIHRLAAAHWMTVAVDGRCRKQRYWTLEPGDELRLRDDAAYLDAFTAELEEAVRCRLRAPDAVGAMLSGGLDSSTVAAVASKELAGEGRRLHTFSAVHPSPNPAADTRFIDVVAAHLPVVAHRFGVEQTLELIGGLDELVDDPDSLFDSWMVLPRVVYAGAAREGGTVVLGGTFGDELLQVPMAPYIDHLLARRRPVRALREAQASVGTESAGRRLRGLRTLASRALVPGRVKTARARRLRARRQIQALEISPLRADPTLQAELVARQERHLAPLEGNRPLRELNTAYFCHSYSVAALERYDRIAARFSIEPRHPFIDRRVVEFCASLPPEQRRRNGWNKWIMRHAAAELLPESIAWRRPAAPLSWYFARRWYQDQQRFTGVADAPLLDPQVVARCRQTEVPVDDSTYRLWRNTVVAASWLENHDGAATVTNGKPAIEGTSL